MQYKGLGGLECPLQDPRQRARAVEEPNALRAPNGDRMTAALSLPAPPTLALVPPVTVIPAGLTGKEARRRGIVPRKRPAERAPSRRERRAAKERRIGQRIAELIAKARARTKSRASTRVDFVPSLSKEQSEVNKIRDSVLRWLLSHYPKLGRSAHRELTDESLAEASLAEGGPNVALVLTHAKNKARDAVRSLAVFGDAERTRPSRMGNPDLREEWARADAAADLAIERRLSREAAARGAAMPSKGTWHDPVWPAHQRVAEMFNAGGVVERCRIHGSLSCPMCSQDSGSTVVAWEYGWSRGDWRWVDAAKIARAGGWTVERVIRLLRHLRVDERSGRLIGATLRDVRVNMPETWSRLLRGPREIELVNLNHGRRGPTSGTWAAPDWRALPVWIAPADIARARQADERAVRRRMAREDVTFTRGDATVTTMPLLEQDLGSREASKIARDLMRLPDMKNKSTRLDQDQAERCLTG